MNLPSWVWIIISVIIVFLVGAFLAQFIFRYIYNYRITNNNIQVILFRIIPLRSVDINNIANINKISYREIGFNPFAAEKWGNRLFGDIVIIKKKKGIIKSIIITPDDADNFIQEVKRRLF